MTDWRVEIPWSDELVLGMISEALTDPKGSPDEALAPNIHHLFLQVGLPHADAHFVRAVLDLNGGQNAVDQMLNECCWRLVRQGLAVLEGGQRFRATREGRAALAQLGPEIRVTLVPGALGATVRERAPDTDQTTLHYVEVAHRCFLGGLQEAAVVMLGVAAERSVDRLITALNGKVAALGIQPLPDQTARKNLDRLSAVLRERGRAIKQALGDRGQWVDDLPGILAGLNAIRLTRNDAGHPEALIERRDEAMNLMAAFPVMIQATTQTAAAIEEL